MSSKRTDVQTLLGGIEAGGTKFNCVIGNRGGEIATTATFPTDDVPEKTLRAVTDFFITGQDKYGPIQALGIASFGPVDLDLSSQTYGHILSTPKQGWSYTNIAGYFSEALRVPIALETDVNGSALGEHAYGAASGLQNYVYVTVGTGIGAGIVLKGRLLQGLSHPELGHILLPQDKVLDDFAGSCPFHGNCLEGLASGTAINRRWRKPPELLPVDHPAWELEAHYLALMCVNITNLCCPERIILGGGVMHQTHLYPMIRDKFIGLVNGYCAPGILQNLESYIVAPGVKDGKSGIMGCLLLADDLAKHL